MKIIIFFFIVIYSNQIFPQQSNLSKAVNHISEFIASERFKEIKENSNDLAAADSIYKEAINLLRWIIFLMLYWL